MKFLNTFVFTTIGALVIGTTIASADPSTTEIIQMCNNPSMDLGELRACYAAVKSLMSSYPAPGMSTLLDVLGDRINEIQGVQQSSGESNVAPNDTTNSDDNSSDDNNSSNDDDNNNNQ